MLKAIILQLQPTAEGELPRTHGSLAYAAALDLISRQDVELSRRLHDDNSYKPFTVSPIFGNFGRHRHQLIPAPNQLYRWRLTGLDQPTSDFLGQLQVDTSPIRFGSATFTIQAVQTSTNQDEDCGQTSYDALWQKWTAQSQPPRQFGVRLLTPTTFRRKKAEINFEQPLPEPDLFFGSLIRSWGTYSAWDTSEMEDFVTRYPVTISNYRIETQRVQLGRRQTVGGVGKVTYCVTRNSTQICQLIGLLIDFGFYAGVGWQRTQGLGQIRGEKLTRR
ncbi:CRISPR-associated endoribonuclease Cas6 [Candidatus Poribacteria bacterium]|nr:CRISPR-associated endoribonuclease Cas6 [Candidatus Poribacteria bacterium]